MKAKAKTPKKALLWAVDPFSPTPNVAGLARESLWLLSRAMKLPVQPVFVLGPEESRVPETLFAQWRSEFAERAMGKLEEHATHPDQLPAKLLIQKGGSMTSKADALVAFARRAKAPLIGLTTSARTGLDRWLVGSFAETLMLRSKVPLLIVRPETKLPKAFRRVLFSTDFGAASQRAFRYLLPTLKLLGAELVLYSRCDLELSEGTLALGFGPSMTESLAPDFESRRKASEKWKALAEKAKIPTRVVLDTRALPTIEGILSTVQSERVDLLALAARSSKVTAALMGSIARMVVRRAEVPVWVVHTS